MNLNLSPIERAKLRLAAVKAEEAAQKQALEDKLINNKLVDVPELTSKGWTYDQSMPWNEKQLLAINFALSGKSFVLIGAAGTGKTTAEKGIVYSLLKNGMLPPIASNHGTKWLAPGKPGIVMTSFTNMAVRQTAKHFSGDVTCVTIHKLLEYAPVYYDIENPDGSVTKKMQFEPSRHSGNPLPRELRVVVIDASSMVDSDLFDKLWDALPNPHAVQFIFLGDLNQLPPVYGGPILGKKLLELPIVELTEVYRQALLSPIIDLALTIKDGKARQLTQKEIHDKKEHGTAILHPWSGSLKWEDALHKANNHMKAALEHKMYNPVCDMILCPYNVNFGVVELNASLADYLGRKRGAEVIEVIAGFNKHYFAVGDKLLVQKQEAVITKIEKNSNYAGKSPLDPKKFTITRWGGATRRKDATADTAPAGFDDVDFDVDQFLNDMSLQGDVVDRKTQASHKIWYRFITDEERKAGKLNELVSNETEEVEDGFLHQLTTSSAINETLFGYALTVHKSQGSEWRRVFFLTHSSHSKMCSRELVYTAATRAREYLYVICEPDRGVRPGMLTAAAKKPRLKGGTLAEKLESLRIRFEREAREKSADKQRKLEESDDE